MGLLVEGGRLEGRYLLRGHQQGGLAWDIAGIDCGSGIVRFLMDPTETVLVGYIPTSAFPPTLDGTPRLSP